MSSLLNVALVAVGSALGGVVRFSIGHLVTRFTGETFPWGTFIVNISGSLFLGWFSTLLKEVWSFAPGNVMGEEQWRLLVAVGVAGGYTTFSTFERETYTLFADGRAWSAIFYITGSVFLGLIAFRVGMLLAGDT
jgi:CrcB protein